MCPLLFRIVGPLFPPDTLTSLRISAISFGSEENKAHMIEISNVLIMNDIILEEITYKLIEQVTIDLTLIYN